MWLVELCVISRGICKWFSYLQLVELFAVGCGICDWLSNLQLVELSVTSWAMCILLNVCIYNRHVIVAVCEIYCNIFMEIHSFHGTTFHVDVVRDMHIFTLTQYMIYLFFSLHVCWLIIYIVLYIEVGLWSCGPPYSVMPHCEFKVYIYINALPSWRYHCRATQK